jgi:epoxide hydrolase 4
MNFSLTSSTDFFAVCWHAAHMRPELFCRLVVACCPHPNCFKLNPFSKQFWRSSYMFLFQIPRLPEALLSANGFDVIRRAFLAPQSGCCNPVALAELEVARYQREIARPGCLTAALNYYRQLLRAATIEPITAVRAAFRRKLTVPTLLLWADKDTAMGQELLCGVETHVADLWVRVLKDCSHWAQVDRPAEFNQAMEEFLQTPL